MKKKGRKKKKRNLFVRKCLLLIVIFLSVILFYVWERVERLEAGYKIREMVKRRNMLSEEKELLLSEAARLKSPQRIEKIAREELGLIVPAGRKSIRRIAVEYKNVK